MKLKITFLALLLCAGAMAQVPLKIVSKSTSDTTLVEDAERISYTEGLVHQIVHTTSGEEKKHALDNIWQVILNDTLHNVTDYLAEDEDCLAFKWAMLSDSELASPMMCMDYYAYFQTEGHRFALFMPTYESAFPKLISFDARMPQAMQLIYTSRGNFPFSLTRGEVLFNYDIETGEIGTAQRNQQLTQVEIINELQLHLPQHTVFFERPEDKAAGFRSGNEYFKTLAGTYIRVNSDGTQVQGGFQMENEANGLLNFTHSQIVETKQKQNGTVYKLDSPILPPSQNTFDVLGTKEGDTYIYDSELCGEFLKLCDVNTDIISRVYQLEDKYNTMTQAGREQMEDFIRSYSFFGTESSDAHSVRNALTLFPKHEFTLYVPTNEAVRQAIAEGLPTWEKIEQLCSASAGEDGTLPEDVRLQAQEQIEELVNFVKYHFHFGCEVADKLPFTARTHNTPVVLRESLATPQLTVSSAGNGTLSVTDARGNVRNVVDTHKNIFVREVWTNKRTAEASSLNGIVVDSFSPGVIHMIDGVLRYK